MKKFILCLLLLCPLAQAQACYKKEMNVEQLTQCANKDSVEAQYNLGVIYYQGKIVPQDYKKAFEWYSKAAKKGDTKSQYNLGWIYYQGNGVKQDYKKSFEWYLKVAQKGDVKAQHNIGWMFMEGKGAKKDKVLAYKWINIAASQGVLNSIQVRDELAKSMTSAQIEKAKKMSADWLAKHPKK